MDSWSEFDAIEITAGVSSFQQECRTVEEDEAQERTNAANKSHSFSPKLSRADGFNNSYLFTH